MAIQYPPDPPAAVSALTASFLAYEDTTKLFVVGAGRVASLIPDAYREVKNIEQVKIWDINPNNASKLAEQLRSQWGSVC